jgi:hypothetical protein
MAIRRQRSIAVFVARICPVEEGMKPAVGDVMLITKRSLPLARRFRDKRAINPDKLFDYLGR